MKNLLLLHGALGTSTTMEPLAEQLGRESGGCKHGEQVVFGDPQFEVLPAGPLGPLERRGDAGVAEGVGLRPAGKKAAVGHETPPVGRHRHARRPGDAMHGATRRAGDVLGAGRVGPARRGWRHGRTDARLGDLRCCLLYTSPSPRDRTRSRMPSSA